MRNLTDISAGVLHVPQLLHEQLQLVMRTLREGQEENFLEGFRIHLAGVAELADNFIVVLADNLRNTKLFDRKRKIKGTFSQI